jgi:hypothetical protein
MYYASHPSSAGSCCHPQRDRHVRTRRISGFDTDEETIKMACAIFLFDTCDMADGVSELGHCDSTSDGDDGTGAAAVEENVGDDLTAAGFNVIYTGLLVNTTALKVMILKCLLCELQYSICPLSRAI